MKFLPFFFSLFLCSQLLAQDSLPIDTSVHYGQLANGLTYYVMHHPEPRERAEFRLVIKTGSLQEEADQLGLAHFVEHMAFNGTAHFAKNTLIDFLERSGSRFGADLNAYTSFAETVYKLQVQTKDPAVVDTALQILKDWAGAITFEPEEVEKERGIIRSEWRSRLSFRQRLQQQSLPALLQNSRYAERLPIGSVTLIDTVATQRLIDYYNRWYQPRRMAVIAVGDFEAAQMLAEIKTHFSTLANRDTTTSPGYPLDETPRQTFLLATDDEAPFTQWEVNYQLESLPTDLPLPERIRYDLLHSLYGGILNKRLAELREEAIQPFTFASAGFGTLPGDYRNFSFSGFTTPEQVLPALRVIATEVQRAALHGFTPEEVAREKEAYLQRIEQFVKELDKTSATYFVQRFVDLYDKGDPPYDLAQFPDLLRQIFPTIEVQDLQTLNAKWQASSIITTIVSTGTTEAPLLPDSSRFHQVLDSIWQSTPAPYQVQALAEQLMLELPPIPSTLPTLVAHDTTLSVSTYRLANGIRIHLKPTDFKEDEILLRGLSPGGLSLVEDADYPSAAHAIPILNASGIAEFKATELYRMLQNKQVDISPFIGQHEEGFSGSSNQEDLETAFQLLHLYFTTPRFDSLTTENYRQKRIEIMERIDTDPRSAFGRLMVDLQYDYQLRRPNTTVGELRAIDRTQALAIYQDRFANPADFEFVIVGNFQLDTLLAHANRYLGSLPSKTSRESWRPIGPTLTDTSIDTTVVAGQTPKAEVQLVWHGDFPYADAQQRYNFISMRELLNLRLREELREERGGVYGVRVSGSIDYQPDSTYYFRLRFNTEPELADTLIQAARQLITDLAQGQISSQEVEKIQAIQRKNYEEALRKNRFWLGQLSRRLASGAGWAGLYPGAYYQYVDGLSTEALQEAVTRYLGPGPRFKMVLLPEE